MCTHIWTYYGHGWNLLWISYFLLQFPSMFHMLTCVLHWVVHKTIGVQMENGIESFPSQNMNYYDIYISLFEKKSSSLIEQSSLVKIYFHKLLINVLNEMLFWLVKDPTFDVSHVMQIATNMIVLEKACNYFAQHVNKLCGIPMRHLVHCKFMSLWKTLR